MHENEIAKVIIDVGFQIHQQLGPGLLESVYESIMVYELRKRGFQVVNQVPVPVFWDGEKMDVGFRADLVVEHKVIVELKSVESVHPVHKKILLTYLRIADRRLGLLINFGADLFKDGVSRVANKLTESE
ncbi:MAG: GxxExxY protein [Pirellula sp.]|jgi:GxxExxY protein|nr:GxxExxY protein [Pirellula sp.]